jgi:hypothetical protein
MEHHTKIPKKIIREKLPIEGLVSAFADLWYPQCIEPWFDHQKTEKNMIIWFSTYFFQIEESWEQLLIKNIRIFINLMIIYFI